MLCERVTLGKHGRMGGDWGCGWNQSPMDNELINCVYAVRPPQTPERTGLGEFSGWWTCAERMAHPDRARELRTPSRKSCPTRLFHPAVPSFILLL